MATSHPSFDLVIAGSGGGGMIAALTAHSLGLKPLIIEKSPLFGGTTSRSGGVLWMPRNRHMAADGVDDSEEDARAYLKEMIQGLSSPERREAFIKLGPQMVDFLEDRTEVRLQSMPGYADYYPELPGGKPGSRCIEARIFNGKKLGAMLGEMNPTAWDLSKKFRMTGLEFHSIAMARRSWAGKKTVMKVGWRMVADFLTGRRHLSMGQSLSAMLAYSLQKADIPMWLDTPLTDLIVEDGRVTGVVARKDGKDIEIHASKGVLLATGGFPHNPELRKRFHNSFSSADWSLAHPGNTGDGHQIAERHGLKLDLMDESWWGPMSILPGGTLFFHISERALPGTIMVDQRGQRFINEAMPYNELVHGMHKLEADAGGIIPCYFITDHTARKNYNFGLMRSGKPGKEYIDSGYVIVADTLEALAEKLNMPAQNLKSTVERYNAMARKGKDEDFGKGDSLYDRRFGDPSIQPNPCMAPLEKGPFYASTLYPGDIGTKGGILTDEWARALKTDGSVLEGLYATGNTTASVMGRSYPGAGATIAASMTFGFIAARHLAGDLG